MIPTDAMKENFDLVTLLGQPMLFSSLRIDRNTLPEGLHGYDLRDSDDCDGTACEIKPYVLVNHFGTVICKKPVELNADGWRELNDDGGDSLNFIGGSFTVDEFLALSPNELTAKCGDCL